MWITADRCEALPGGVDLATVAADLARTGRTASVAAVVNRVPETTPTCWKPYTLQASWADLALLRDQYHWSVISDGMTHNDMTTMTHDQQVEESCGSLTPLAAHGHDRAWGLFAYGDNNWTKAIQRDVVASCFAYGRRYHEGINVRSQMTPPWFQRTNSVLGGRCNDPTLPSATADVKNGRVYWLPDKLISRLPAGPDEWTVLQFYRLVSGRRSTGTWQWDCTAPSARAHWTSDPELYCYEDFQTVVAAIPDQVQTVDPTTVATAWGRGK